MAVTRIYHPVRKWAVKHILYGSVAGIILAEAYWHFSVVKKVERRNMVMSLIEDERRMKRDALRQAYDELNLPAQGSANPDDE